MVPHNGEELQNLEILNKVLEISDKFDFILLSGYKTYILEKFKIQYHTEAVLMKYYLLKYKNSLKSKLILEKKSRDTLSNAYYSYKLINKNFNFSKVKIFVIAFDNHIKKAEFFFRYVFNKKEIDYIPVQVNNNKKIFDLYRKNYDELILTFFDDLLVKKYNIKKGELNKIKYFIKNINPATNGNIKNKYFAELSNNIEKFNIDFYKKYNFKL